MRAGAARAGGGGVKNLSNWRSVRLWEAHVERDLRQRHWLRLHGLCIGAMVMGVMWLTSYVQMLLGQNRLALRYLVTLGVGYLVYLLVLRMWASMLVRRDSSAIDGGGDLPIPDAGGTVDFALHELPVFRSGGGGNFGGGGATGDFSGAAESSDVLSDVATGALEAAAGADEGAVVAIPVVAIFLIGCALVLGTGSLLMLYFGWEALLTVAVELAFSYVSARTAVRVVRQGWLSAALRLTWKPMLGALLCAVLLGATMDHFVPGAQSLPQAIKLIRASIQSRPN